MTTVKIYESFDALPESYTALFSDASARLGVFASLPWFNNLAKTVFKDEKKIRIYGIETGTEPMRPCLALPMSFEEKCGGFLSPRRLTSAGNYYTSFFSPITADEANISPAPLAALAAAIATDSPRWDVIDFHPMAPGTALFDGLIQALRSSRMAVQRYFCFGNWYLDVNGRSFKEYHENLPSKLRNTLARKSRQLTASNRLAISLVVDGRGVDEAVASFVQVYNASWKRPEPFPDFIPGLIRTCAQHGWLRMGVAHIDGEPAAAQIWIVNHGIAYIYKLAYAEKYSKLSVGSILTSRLMEHVIDVDKVNEVDYLTGDDSYKRDWMSHRRVREGIVAFNLRTSAGVILACRHLGGQMAKRWSAGMRHRVHAGRKPAGTDLA